MWCDQIWGFIKRHSTVPGAVVLFATTYVLVLAMSAGEAGAAWVQAFGSIAAIVAVFLVADLAHKRERQQARLAILEGDSRAAKLVESAVYEAWRALLDVCKQIDDGHANTIGGGSGVKPAGLNVAVEIMRSLVVQPLTSATIGAMFIVIRELSESIIEIEQFGSSGPGDGGLKKLKLHASSVAACRLIIEGEHVRLALDAGLKPTNRVGD